MSRRRDDTSFDVSLLDTQNMLSSRRSDPVTSWDFGYKYRRQPPGLLEVTEGHKFPKFAEFLKYDVMRKNVKPLVLYL